ncbi:hypothetical protein SAMD00023353_1700340 [Rosellinia necatrix]|uniref:Uncharacterized protein n=1 Tax=Rosellinia necatrix TaxID=77044 RepID=A0A1W2TKW3_ROSNE|nr:hypothetical protein SAMD00023353_1700340 [Rosellinia necatrix]
MDLQLHWPTTWDLGGGADEYWARGWLFWTVTGLLLYAPLCAIIRRHQKHRVVRGHGPIEKMTLEEAYAVKTWLAEHEMPLAFSAATNIAFFKAEAIPSIAKVVAARAAQHRSSPSTTSTSGSKPRAASGKSASVTPADLLRRPGSAARRAAVSRVNGIHAGLRRGGGGGRLTDDDLAYTLAVFAGEPGRWAARLEGRGLAARERAAVATLWRRLGRELGVELVGRLPSAIATTTTTTNTNTNTTSSPSSASSSTADAGDGFRDALHWMRELEAWGAAYEAARRGRCAEGEALGEAQVRAWVAGVPACLRGAARGLVAAVVEPGLRRAMGIQEPSRASVFIVETVIYVRMFVRACFCSPVALVNGYRRG